MLSKLEYTSPAYIAEDMAVDINVVSIKDGVKSEPITFTLTAKAQAPVVPTFTGKTTGAPGSVLKLTITTEPNTTLDVRGDGNAQVVVKGNIVEVTLADISTDANGNLTIKAIRGAFESPELTIPYKIFIEEPSKPVIQGSSAVNENTQSEYTITADADTEIKVSVTKGTASLEGNKVLFVAPEVVEDEVVTLTVTSSRKSKTASTDFEIQVQNVKQKTPTLELVDNQAKTTDKGTELVVQFKSVVGSLAIKNADAVADYGVSVDGETIKIAATKRGSFMLEVTQTSEGNLESEVLTIAIKVQDLSTKLVAAVANPAEVKALNDIMLSFDNATGTLEAQGDEFASAEVQDTQVKVTGLKEGNATIQVTQTEADKDPSEPLSLIIAVKAADKQETLVLADSQALTTEVSKLLNIAFKNLTGTLAAEITEGSTYATITVESDKIVLTPTAAGEVKISATQSADKTITSDALEITITITEAQTEPAKTPEEGQE